MHAALLEQALAAGAEHYHLLREHLGSEIMGVWLIGSAILDDLAPGSDVDSLTLTSRPLDAADHDVLRTVHEQLRAAYPVLTYDTTYLSVASLGSPPPTGMVTPFTQDGVLHLNEMAGELHPVTWFTLPAARVAAGLAPEEVSIAADRAAAEAHARGNLQTYWGSVAQGIRLQLTGREPEAPLPSPDPVLWAVLGAPRLAAFLSGMRTRGPIPSKSEGGRWVIDNLPQHAELARRALRARAGQPEVFTVAEAQQATDLVMTIVHGHG